MNYTERLTAAIAELNQSKIRKSNYAPPIFNLLRKVGFDIRPFHYNSFIINFALSASWFAIVWGFLMWLFVWQFQSMSIAGILVSSVSGGILFGFMLAIYYKLSAKRNGLTPWQQL